MSLEAVSDIYNFTSTKFQNFEYQFEIVERLSNRSKIITVHGTSLLAIKLRLESLLHFSKFQIIEIH